MKHTYLGLILFLMIVMPLSAQKIGGGGEANPNLHTNRQALQAWQNMKFGLFIHWGPVSLRGTEIGWSRGREVPIDEYDALYKEFNPVLFDADVWVRTAKQAGMKYIVITSKHHDGFCIWDSDYTDYDIMSTPFKRDILRELADACRRHGILFGTYHSILDWHHPHYTTRYGGDPRPIEGSDMQIYVQYLKNQVRELIEKYDTNILWFDGEWEASWNHRLGMDLYRYCRELKDNLLINNRVDKGRQGMKGMTISSKFAGDFGTPEQEVGAFHPDVPWESCITLCRQWAWKPNDRMKTLRECIQTLVRTAGGGGNLLLNVGPMPDGRIEQRQIDRLLEIGDWLRLNGASIYGTRGGPYRPTDWLVSTNKGNIIYVHLLDWPVGDLRLPAFAGRRVESVAIIGGQALSFQQRAKTISIKLPGEPVDVNDTVIRIRLDGKVASLPPVDVPTHVLRGLSNAEIILKHPFSQKYAANGSQTLVDKIRGSRMHSDGHWLGFEGVDFVARIDLGIKRDIAGVRIGFLQKQSSWIFLPTRVDILVSDDGKRYEPAVTVDLGQPKPDSTIRIRDVHAAVNRSGIRYLEIRAHNVGVCPSWHKGSGGKAWLFVDEIILE